MKYMLQRLLGEIAASDKIKWSIRIHMEFWINLLGKKEEETTLLLHSPFQSVVLL